MKKIFFSLLTLMTFGIASAQTDPQKSTEIKDAQPSMKPATDTMTVNGQIKKDTDLREMDAVKTQDHPKTTKKSKTLTKDTTAIKNTRRK